jgi:hypothetical protein
MVNLREIRAYSRDPLHCRYSSHIRSPKPYLQPDILGTVSHSLLTFQFHTRASTFHTSLFLQQSSLSPVIVDPNAFSYATLYSLPTSRYCRCRKRRSWLGIRPALLSHVFFRQPPTTAHYTTAEKAYAIMHCMQSRVRNVDAPAKRERHSIVRAFALYIQIGVNDMSNKAHSHAAHPINYVAWRFSQQTHPRTAPERCIMSLFDVV